VRGAGADHCQGSEARPAVNYQVLGYLDDDVTPEEALDGLPVLGREADLPHLNSSGNFSRRSPFTAPG
jgi:hypothetical protein